MRCFSDMGFRVRPVKEYLLFLLGLVSTWQIVQVAGFALSTWLTILTAGYLLLTQGFRFRRDWLLIALLVSAGITLAVSMVSDIPGGYKKASLMGTIQWGMIFVICAYVRREQTDDCTAAFFRGFDWSCKIQLAWSALQMGAWYLLKIDINAKIFGQLLRMSNETSLYRDGILACTGLHWHAANLIPVLVYTYFRHRSLLVKGLCIVLAYLTKNATALIAIGGALLLDVLRFAKRTLCDRHCAVRYKVAVYIMLGVMGILLVSPLLLPKVWEMVKYLLLRLYQIQNPTEGYESSAVHFNYYRYLPDVLRSIPAREVLAGSGMGTSGYRFTVLLWQFPDAIWTVESDPVNLILSQGILGAALHYGFLGYLTWRLLRRKQGGQACFIVVLLICGFAYNNQFLWVQLLEFMLYCQVRNRATTIERKP